MPDITVVSPPLLMVSWSCKRCGHAGGVAKTTVPIEPTFTTAMGHVMLGQLRKKLVRVHQRGQGCIALPDDFVIERYRL
jgi:hypothetical protein